MFQLPYILPGHAVVHRHDFHEQEPAAFTALARISHAAALDARRKAAVSGHVAGVEYGLANSAGSSGARDFDEDGKITAICDEETAPRGPTLFEKGKPERIAGLSRDADAEKAAAQAFQEREKLSEQLASIALAAPGVMGSFFIASNGHVAYRYVSPKAKAIFGVEAADICADAGNFFRRLRPEDLDDINAGLFKSAREMSLWVVEFLFEHPEKGLIWLEAQAAPVREANGLIVWHGYASDVTSRKLSELSLAETAARLQAMIDGAQDAVLTLTVAGCIQSVNKAGAVIFGYDPEEMIGLNLGDLVSEPDKGEPFSIGAERVGERFEICGKRRNGLSFPGELSLSEAKFAGERLLAGFIKDLSGQRRMEARVERLRQDRLDALGGMATALAHEINQPLSATATYLKVARRLLDKSRPPGGADVMDVLDKATAQTLRAGRIVTNLRDLVQRGEPDKTIVSMHALIREAQDSVLAESALSGVAVRLDCHAVKDQVVADRTQLRQVLRSLIRNAVDAVQFADRRELVVATSNPDDLVIRVDVADTGCGISADDECFEPFTTTKAKGMGIGLSISRSIIEAHYGRIWARANPGGGAVFSFTLPLQDSEIDL